jgi:hypothetical protein
LLAGHSDGCDEAVLLADGFTVGELAALVMDGFAKSRPTVTPVSGPVVVWVRITAAGREAIAEWTGAWHEQQANAPKPPTPMPVLQEFLRWILASGEVAATEIFRRAQEGWEQARELSERHKRFAGSDRYSVEGCGGRWMQEQLYCAAQFMLDYLCAAI